MDSDCCSKCCYNSGGFWICCDTCDKWFHARCVRMRIAQAKETESWSCVPCRRGISLKVEYLQQKTTKRDIGVKCYFEEVKETQTDEIPKCDTGSQCYFKEDKETQTEEIPKCDTGSQCYFMEDEETQTEEIPKCDTGSQCDFNDDKDTQTKEGPKCDNASQCFIIEESQSKVNSSELELNFSTPLSENKPLKKEQKYSKLSLSFKRKKSSH